MSEPRRQEYDEEYEQQQRRQEYEEEYERRERRPQQPHHPQPRRQEYEQGYEQRPPQYNRADGESGSYQGMETLALSRIPLEEHLIFIEVMPKFIKFRCSFEFPQGGGPPRPPPQYDDSSIRYASQHAGGHGNSRFIYYVL